MSPPTLPDSGARVPATTEMEDAAAGGGECTVTAAPPPPTCPVCMEPWTCNGDHRICCIPCGHVYGRSCLERWLHRCGDRSAKELKAHYKAEIHETKRRFAECMEKAQFNIEKLRIELVGRCTKMKEQNSKEIAEFQDRTRVQIQSLHGEAFQTVDQIVKMWNREKATTNANLETMKERMKKMAEEENATAMELIEFMELTFRQSPAISYPCDFASVFAPDPMDSENTSRRLNRPDQLIPVPTLPCPADAASKRRRRGT